MLFLVGTLRRLFSSLHSCLNLPFRKVFPFIATYRCSGSSRIIGVWQSLPMSTAVQPAFKGTTYLLTYLLVSLLTRAIEGSFHCVSRVVKPWHSFVRPPSFPGAYQCLAVCTTCNGDDVQEAGANLLTDKSQNENR